MLAALDAPEAQIGRADGDAAAALPRAARTLTADYTVPFLAHATMEPQTCTAHVRADGVEIWAPSQDPMTALVTAAVAAGVPNEKVTVHRMMLGGGFGRRGPIQEYVRQAVDIAKNFDEPVKMVWSREQDIAHDLYRPCGMARLTAGLDADGMPLAWTIRLAGPSFVAALVPGFGSNIIDRSYVSGLGDEWPYDVPNYLVDYVICPTPVPLGVWRAINYTQNAFYKECFLDEMAHAAGIDPYLYRRKLLAKSPKSLAVLDAAAQESRLGQSAAARRLSRHCGQRRLRQLLRGSGRGFRHRRRGARASRRLRARFRPCRQSAVGRNADARRRHLCFDGGAYLARSRSRTAPPSNRISTPTKCCASPMRRKSKP